MVVYFYTALPCPAGMVYQQCGPLCPQTCDNLGLPCEGGCAEGCFCPMGEVLLRGLCVNSSQCEGLLCMCMYCISKYKIFQVSQMSPLLVMLRGMKQHYKMLHCQLVLLLDHPSHLMYSGTTIINQ